jgi:DNA-binding FrmR family transcriptional regulator
MTALSSHPDIIKRLKRAEGHLKRTIAMLDEGSDCLDVTQQLQAVESAIANAKKTLIHEHIDLCLERAVREGKQSMAEVLNEFKAITKYL